MGMYSGAIHLRYWHIPPKPHALSKRNFDHLSNLLMNKNKQGRTFQYVDVKKVLGLRVLVAALHHLTVKCKMQGKKERLS